MNAKDVGEAQSPFHPAEQAVQDRLGVRDQVEAFGRRFIRDALPEQHRDFYAQLPFVAVGSVDATGWPWASLVAGPPGFLAAPDPKHLRLAPAVAPGDPLQDNLRPGAALGLLGLDLATRRRNRANVRVTAARAAAFTLEVDQAFGNCPQYIQTRAARAVRAPEDFSGTTHAPVESLSDEDAALIRGADTLFVASAAAHLAGGAHGVDVSHRGGRPGFVAVEGDTLTVPDFAGNLHFNTLGNFVDNPKAGLLFVDFEAGDVLSLTGSVEILWEDAPEVRAFEGAERAWRFTLDHGVRIRDALPLRWAFGAPSPNTMITGTWPEARATLEAERRRDAWRRYRLVQVRDESATIRSFYLQPADGLGLPTFEAGQFLTVRLEIDGIEAVRTYTLSSAPGDPQYRISVQRESTGLVSRHLHEALRVGDTLEARAPRGDFTIDAAVRRPAALLVAGVGVTPAVAMARHVAREGLRTRHLRPLTILHAARSAAERGFARELRRLAEGSQGRLRYVSLLSRPAPEDEAEVFGRLDADVLRRFLPLDDYDFYVCGPGGFMQAAYDALLELGARDVRIHAEAFGPSALARRRDAEDASRPAVPEAEHALVRFRKSGFEQRWDKEAGTLLELAEAHGLSPTYGCRSGACGSCAVRLEGGEVTYRGAPRGPRAADEALICCAVPAADGGTVVLDL